MKKAKLDKHSRMYGPHFNEECAMHAVKKMENEDGTRGAHWTLEQTSQLAQQFGIDLTSDHFNKYDWFVALNMIYSDFCKVISLIPTPNKTKLFVDFAKAWLHDKDIEEGKMWYYFVYIMCEEGREEDDDDDDYSGHYAYARGRGRGRGRMALYHKHHYDDYDDEDEDEYEYELRGMYNMRGSNYAMDDNYARGRRTSRY